MTFKRLDEITLNMSAEREEHEVRKMGRINKGDRATVSGEGAGGERVGLSRKPRGDSFKETLLKSQVRQSED